MSANWFPSSRLARVRYRLNLVALVLALMASLLLITNFKIRNHTVPALVVVLMDPTDTWVRVRLRMLPIWASPFTLLTHMEVLGVQGVHGAHQDRVTVHSAACPTHRRLLDGCHRCLLTGLA